MDATIESTLAQLGESGNLRRIPADGSESLNVDFTSNDYLGIGTRRDLRSEFFATVDVEALAMSASASRLLAKRQASFAAFEAELSDAYRGRPALLFNSGYHANTGMVSALATNDRIVLADRLVHASIIDGIKLGGARFERFRHNDMSHLRRLADKAVAQGLKPLIIAESVYSMDGDSADIEGLAEVKRTCPGALLYVDEAHAVGVEGPQGRGVCMASPAFADVDVLVGTLGKALASVGAYVVTDAAIRDFAVNRARSFIFSTALPPVNIEWSRFVFDRMAGMDAERAHLKALGRRLSEGLATLGATAPPSHIQPYVVGSPVRAVELSRRLAERGYDVLPIRTPTVPPGTDRLRLSLSAAMGIGDIDGLVAALDVILKNDNE